MSSSVSSLTTHSSTMEPPLVSIIISNYNYDLFVEEAIQSALDQNYPRLEVVVVDDGSTDNSRDVISKHVSNANRPIIPVFKENGGQASAFNAGLQASNGEIICFLDSDDVFDLEKVEKIVPVFEAYPDVGWCFHPLRYVQSGTGTVIATYPPAPVNAQHEIDFRDEINKRAKVPTWGPATSGLCFRRSLLQKILPMPEEINISSDYYLRYSAVSSSKGFFLDAPLTDLRIHGNNAWTLQSDRAAKKSRVFLLTGYWLNNNFPALKRLANKNFGMGMGMQWWAGKPDLRLRDQVILPYLSTLSLLERVEVQLRASVHWGKLAWQSYRANLSATMLKPIKQK